MGILWNRKKKIRAETEARAEQEQGTFTITLDEFLRGILKRGNTIQREQVEGIPAVKSCINAIANIVTTTPIKLYEKVDGEVKEIQDNRTYLLNTQTGDTLNNTDFWKALITDYFLGQGGYAFVERRFNDPISLRYVKCEQVSFTFSPDPIYKSYSIYVNGERYGDYEFLRLLRNTRNGYSGTSIGEEFNELLTAAYATLNYEVTTLNNGGNKRGFLLSNHRLGQEELDNLKENFQKLYSTSNEKVMVLNDGISFKELSNSSAEMQVQENKSLNNALIHEIFGVPLAITEGKYTQQEKDNFIENAVLPMMQVIITECNRVLLTEDEKQTKYFAFDVTELLKGNMKERYEAYAIGIDKNFLQIDEVRSKENLKPLGLNFVKLGLQDVLYDIENNTIYTPNTNQIQDMDNLKQQRTVEPEKLLKGGEEKNEGRNS